MELGIANLIKKARAIGINKLAMPIDVFSTATELSDHPDSPKYFDELLSLIEDENYLTGWAGARAINQMGHLYIAKARKTMERQLKIEDYQFTKEELEGALLKIHT